MAACAQAEERRLRSGTAHPRFCCPPQQRREQTGPPHARQRALQERDVRTCTVLPPREVVAQRFADDAERALALRHFFRCTVNPVLLRPFLQPRVTGVDPLRSLCQLELVLMCLFELRRVLLVDLRAVSALALAARWGTRGAARQCTGASDTQVSAAAHYSAACVPSEVARGSQHSTLARRRAACASADAP